MQGAEGGEASRRPTIDDETTLRLKVFRGLGIDLERDEKGAYGKAIVRNGRKGDVCVVNIDEKFSTFFYANYFWDSL
jgi:kinetochore protein Spc24